MEKGSMTGFFQKYHPSLLSSCCRTHLFGQAKSFHIWKARKEYMPYMFLDDIATADAAFEAEGRTMEELFRYAATATFEVMVDTGSVNPIMTWRIELKNETVDGLLFDWLSELVYLKDAEGVFFCKFDLSIEKNDAYELKAGVAGETIDREKHILRSDVKAVTYHLFEVGKVGEKWYARVVLDI
jgi:SHS2 domain-containing protein